MKRMDLKKNIMVSSIRFKIHMFSKNKTSKRANVDVILSVYA
jgi:hypothetical protein